MSKRCTQRFDKINTLVYLRVSVAEERPVVDVGAAADDKAVVDDEQPGVHVDQLGDRRVQQRRVRAQRAEAVHVNQFSIETIAGCYRVVHLVTENSLT